MFGMERIEFFNNKREVEKLSFKELLRVHELEQVDFEAIESEVRETKVELIEDVNIWILNIQICKLKSKRKKKKK